MHQEIIQQLKKLNAIEPDAEFVRRSRNHIVSMKNEPAFAFPSFSFFPRLSLVGAFVFAGLLLAIFYPFSFSSNQTFSALSAEAINREFDNLSINMQLNEIKFDQNAHQTIAAAIMEITDMKTQHLSSQILESENVGMTIDETGNQIDELLNQVIN